MKTPATYRKATWRRFLVYQWLTVVFVLVGVYFALEALNFRGNAVPFPFYTGLCVVALAVAELVRGYASASRDTETMQTKASVPEEDSLHVSWQLEAKSWVWFLSAVVLVYLIGILPSALLSGAAYSVVFLGCSILRGSLWGMAMAVSLWLIFAQLAGFELYWGIFLH